MFSEYLQKGFIDIPLESALLRLIVAGAIGFLISLIFKRYNREVKVQKDMVHSLIFLSMIICIAMMAIGNNLASAFGLVGAVSIIRFRTSVKSSRDMAFVFFTIVIGMACGLGFVSLAILGFLIVGGTMLIIFSSGYGQSKSVAEIYRLKISYIGKISDKKYIDDILEEFSTHFRVNSVKTEFNKISFVYQIKLINFDLIDSINNSMEKIPDIKSIKIQLLEME